ncbi:guanylate kinase [Lysinibacter cavernae]|uniref:Guanylate kinase n=1 Tax=Lysinibacter cavernae TaxID=1640652 RepID=A0A7X5QZA3_9MICO|nr:guanylate kinase [Lysinibacter cavernae]NIH52723.1 guanylate kinase [Lysinibacter cavernae]
MSAAKSSAMPEVDRIAANKAAIAARQARAALKAQLRDGVLSPEDALTLSTDPSSAAHTLRVTDFLLCLPAVGVAKMPRILEQLEISDKKRLGGLGVHQRKRLEQYLRSRLATKGTKKDARPRLTVLAGPTAVGKGTVATYIREHYPEIALSVSATTRAPRPGEVEGKHYYFVTDAEFDRMIAEGELLEYATVHNAYRYGTPRGPIEESSRRGRPVLLEIDLQGARQVRDAMPDARLVFLAPPSWDELVSRLVGRGTESAEEQERRLTTAKVELASQNEFDHVVINDTVERAAESVVHLMKQL